MWFSVFGLGYVCAVSAGSVAADRHDVIRVDPMRNTPDVCVKSDVINEMTDRSTMNKIMECIAVDKAIVRFDMIKGRRSARDASLCARPNDPVDMACKIVELLDDEPLRQRMGAYERAQIEDKLEWAYEAPK